MNFSSFKTVTNPDRSRFPVFFFFYIEGGTASFLKANFDINSSLKQVTLDIFKRTSQTYTEETFILFWLKRKSQLLEAHIFYSKFDFEWTGIIYFAVERSIINSFG